MLVNEGEMVINHHLMMAKDGVDDGRFIAIQVACGGDGRG